MNKTLASYLANVATAAEVAPFGVPGLWHMNNFFNSSLVWAASAVVQAKHRLATEPTFDSEMLVKAKVRLHTIKAIYNSYGESVAINHLELPHVQRALGLDREPDLSQLKADAKKSAMTAVEQALIMGRSTVGLFGAEYAKKLASANATRLLRQQQLEDVYDMVHTTPDPALYDEAECATFTDRLYSQCMSIARANWQYSEAQLTDTSLKIFHPEKYTRYKAVNEGCAAFLAEHGIKRDQLLTWSSNVHKFSAHEAELFDKTLAQHEAAAKADMEAYEQQEQLAEAAQKAANRFKRVPTEASITRLHEATQAAEARKAEDITAAAKKAAQAAKKAAKKAAKETTVVTA